MATALQRNNGPISPFDTDSGLLTYTVDLGDGRTVNIQGPSGATAEQLHAVIQSNPDLAPPAERAVAGDAGTEAPDQMEGGFGDQLPAQAQSHLSAEDEAQYQTLLRHGSASDISHFLAARHRAPQWDIGAFTRGRDKMIAAGHPELVNYGVTYALPTVTDEDTGGKTGAVARGAGDSLTLGTADKAHSFVQAIKDQANGSANSFLDDWNMESDRTHAIEQFDEENHGYTRIAGQLLGGLPLPGGLAKVAISAEHEALSLGYSAAEAKKIGAIALRNRIIKMSGGYGAGHGALSADSPGDAIKGAVVEGSLGALTGGAIGEIGSRLANRATVPADGLDTANNIAQGVENVAQADVSPNDVLSAASRQNITLLPQDVGGEGVKRATQGAAQTTFGANTVKQAASRLYDGFRDRVLALSGNPQSTADVGGTLKENSAALAGREAVRADQSSQLAQDAVASPTDATGAGQILQRGATQWMQDSADKAAQLYDKISIPGGVKAILSNTRAILVDLTKGMQSNRALSKLWAENPRLKSTLEALDPQKNGNLSWDDLKRFRSIIGDIIGSPGLESDGAQVAALRKLYGGLSDDMRSTAASIGPRQLSEFNRANSYYSARMSRINQTISRVLGADNSTAPNQAFGAVESALRDSASGDPAFVARILRTIPKADADIVRATVINRARGGASFDPAILTKAWGSLSERGKSALLPQAGVRQIMDDAAERAAASTRDPLANKSGEQVYLALEKMAENAGDSARFAKSINDMSPEEANSVRSLLIHRMGLADAGQQNAAGDTFSISKFLTRWNQLSPRAKMVLFGNDSMRSNMNDLALLAERVKASEKLAGHSNTGAVNSFNATTGGLGAAAMALLTGHPIVAGTLAAPAAYQRASAELLTSQRFLNWLAKAPKKPNPSARLAHIQRLSSIARAEPAIANQVLQLQEKLADVFGSAPARVAAQPAADGVGDANRRDAVGASQQNQQELRP